MTRVTMENLARWGWHDGTLGLPIEFMDNCTRARSIATWDSGGLSPSIAFIGTDDSAASSRVSTRFWQRVREHSWVVHVPGRAAPLMLRICSWITITGVHTNPA